MRDAGALVLWFVVAHYGAGALRMGEAGLVLLLSSVSRHMLVEGARVVVTMLAASLEPLLLVSGGGVGIDGKGGTDDAGVSDGGDDESDDGDGDEGVVAAVVGVALAVAAAGVGVIVAEMWGGVGGATSDSAEGADGVDDAGSVFGIGVAAAGVAIGGIGAVDVAVAAGDGVIVA